jgi:hypothetical protein
MNGLDTVRQPSTFSHADLTRSEHCPKQHRGGFSFWQHRLRLDPPPELFVD